jgi:hypothetical protein
MPIAIQCRRAPRNAVRVIVENLECLYTSFSSFEARSKTCARRDMKKSRTMEASGKITS